MLNVRERALLHSITTRVGGRSCTGPRYNMRVGVTEANAEHTDCRAAVVNRGRLPGISNTIDY